MKSPRVLSVTSNFPRWVGDSTTHFVFHLAQDLQSLGWTVDVLAPHAAGTATEEVMGGVRVERFRYLWPDSQESVCYQGGALINLRKNRFNYLKLPVLVVAEWAAVRRRLVKGQYALLHSHWILPQGFVGGLIAPHLRIPHVITAHGSDVFALGGRVMTGFKRYALRRADVITANSAATEQAVHSIGRSAAQVIRIPMGVSLDAPEKSDSRVRELRSRFRRSGGALVSFVGRLVEEKGLSDLLMALARLRGKFKDLTLLIVGDGPDREALEQRTRDMELSDRVFFTGWVAPESIPYYLTAADVFVAPSWFEGQGLTVLEAMASGTPVVATNVGGMVDSVIHEHTGLLVDRRAPEQIAAAVKRLLVEPGLGERLQLGAKAYLREGFSREASAREFSKLFLNLTDCRLG